MRRLDTPAGPLCFDGGTKVMGVLNLSPESHNTQTVATTVPAALELAARYREWGAEIIDVGAQSSRYDVPTLDVDEEIRRLVPAVEALSAEGHLVSVDTWKPEVARAGVAAGAAIVNDTGGLGDPEMRRVVAESGAAAIVVYVEGANPHAVDEIDVRPDKAAVTARWLAERVTALEADGIDRVIVDPGIAINYPGDYAGYTRMQLDVIRRLDVIRTVGPPVLVPIPRKQEDHRVMAYITLAVEHGADIIRVHDVAEACDLVRLLTDVSGGAGRLRTS